MFHFVLALMIHFGLVCTYKNTPQEAHRMNDQELFDRLNDAYGTIGNVCKTLDISRVHYFRLRKGISPVTKRMRLVMEYMVNAANLSAQCEDNLSKKQE